MTGNGWLQIALFTLLVALLVRPLGGYMTRVFRGEPTSPSSSSRTDGLGRYRRVGAN
jgi:potassium-transporting ATPase potassium-binding subunit